MIDGIPIRLFYLGTAVVLLLSFGGVVMLGPRPDARASGFTYDLTRFRLVERALSWRPFRFLAQAFTVALFLLVIAAGLFGVQRGGANIATVLTWTYW